jgi:hypothetical protein
MLANLTAGMRVLVDFVADDRNELNRITAVTPGTAVTPPRLRRTASNQQPRRAGT